MSERAFRKRVLDLVSDIPRGKVATYGMIALLCGSPRAARQVGWVLHSLGNDEYIPWWRVVNRNGYLSIRNDDILAKMEQRNRLLRENVAVDDGFCVDLKRYLWKPPDLS